MVSAPRCRPGARGLLALLLLLLLPLPGARGLCGAPPRLSRASPQDTSCTEGCPIGTEVTYRCRDDLVKIPGKSDTVVCLSNSEWSNFGEFCNGGCGAPPRLKSATLSKEDGQKNYYPYGTTASYVCRPGYESTELKRVITCLENLTWSEAPEFCIAKSCGVPKGPEHGRAVVLTNDLYGAIANIICDDGFRLCGRPSIQCLPKGDQVEWSQLPTCQAVTCSPPPNIANGTHNGSNVEIFVCNSSVTYKCDHNFLLTGEASIQCTTKDNINGVWNGSAPECKGTCDSPPRLSFAELPGVVNNSYPVGTELKYSCRPGYVLGSGKSPLVVCLANSTWSVDPEFCVGIPCKQLELENGRVHLKDRQVGATANFSCDEGYRLIGTTSTQCVVAENGVNWDKELPHCQAIPCPPPPDITHGSHTGQSEQEFSFGSVVTYKCDQGFSLIGEASIHCTTKDNVNGEWSGPAPECKAIPCLPPPDITSGSHTGQSEQEFSFGSAVTYKCDQGFSLIGEASIHCTTKDNINGEWSGPAPECKGICDSPPRLSFAELPGTVNDSYPVGTELTYSCRPGYVLGSGKSPLVVCLANSTWSVDPEFCVGRLCKQLELENGRVDLTDLRFGATATFSCNEGYRLIGTTSAQCVVAGNGVNWDKRLPHCQGTCDSPPRLSFAELPGVVNNSYPVGTELTYSCRPGYILGSGKSPLVVCLANSTWSVDPEFCVGICDSPPRLSFAELPGTVNDSYPVGTELKYSCRPGYVLGSGKSPLVVCLANSTWSVDPEFCVGRLCKQLELENGRVDLTDLRFGATANFSCDEGYRLIGMISAQCVVAGNGVNWDKRLPHCQAIPCLPPPDIANGSHTGQSEQEFSFGSAVTYKCDQGFSLIGEASIHCTTKDNVNGEWSGPAPECKAITCSPPPNIANGTHNGSNVEIFVCNSSVTYKCVHNFSLIGEASIHCTTKDNINGVWNGSVPECKAQCGPARRLRRDTNGKEAPDVCNGGSGKSPDPGLDTRIGIPGIGSNIATVTGITVAAIAIAIAIVTGIVAALQKKGSYGVNLDSPKYHIAPEDDLQMSETKSNLIIKV